MAPSEWKKLAAFGVLLVGLSLWDARVARYVGGAVILVYLIRHPEMLPNLGG